MLLLGEVCGSRLFAEVPSVDPPRWLTPRLALPVPPSFDYSDGADEITVRWLGRVETVRTSVIVGGALRRTRSVRRSDHRIEVRDTFVNSTREAVGVKVRHHLSSSSADVRLGGTPATPDPRRYNPWNPTVFVPVQGAGLGLVAEDSVLRQQLVLESNDPRHVGFGTEMLCIGAHSRYTMEWSIYPIASDSYWDFISTVRRDWSSNHTIPGSFLWFTPRSLLRISQQQLGAALDRHGVGIASVSGGWIDPDRTERPPLIGFGSYVMSDVFEELRDAIRAAAARLHAVRPGLKVLVYFDSRRESHPRTLRMFHDSLVIDDRGHPRATTWGGSFSVSWLVYPTRDNRYGNALRRVPAAMRALGADGLYWDEMSTLNYGPPELTFDRSDGHTCTLGDDARIERRVGIVNLLAEEADLALAGDAGLVLGNSPPGTRAFQERRDLRMVETQHGPKRGAFAHLTTPLGYVGDQRDWTSVLARLAEGLLIAGTRLDDPYDILKRMYPITPDYIQAGTIHGEERIVTMQPGTHGWLSGGGEVKQYAYDASGKERSASWPVRRDGAAVYVDVMLGTNEAAVIERTH